MNILKLFLKKIKKKEHIYAWIERINPKLRVSKNEEVQRNSAKCRKPRNQKWIAKLFEF